MSTETATLAKWGMSLKFEAVPTVILEELPALVSNAQYKAYLTLIRFLRDDEMVARVSREKLAEKFKVSIKAVSQTMAGLRAAGLIEYKQLPSGKSGEFLCNEYDLKPGLLKCLAAAGAAYPQPQEAELPTEDKPLVAELPTVPQVAELPTKQTSSFPLTNNYNMTDDNTAGGRVINFSKRKLLKTPEEKEQALLDALGEYRNHDPELCEKHKNDNCIGIAFQKLVNRMINKELPLTDALGFLLASLPGEVQRVAKAEEERLAREVREAAGGRMKPSRRNNPNVGTIQNMGQPWIEKPREKRFSL